MKRVKNGSFTATLYLRPGCEYEFRYLLDAHHLGKRSAGRQVRIERLRRREFGRGPLADALALIFFAIGRFAAQL